MGFTTQKGTEVLAVPLPVTLEGDNQAEESMGGTMPHSRSKVS